MQERKVAIVTGASCGIGKAVAKELALLGYDLVVNYLDFTSEGKADESAAELSKKEIEAIGGKCEILRGDISETETGDRLVALTKSQFGRVDMLVNNAGVAPSKRVDILEASKERMKKRFKRAKYNARPHHKI